MFLSREDVVNSLENLAYTEYGVTVWSDPAETRKVGWLNSGSPVILLEKFHPFDRWSADTCVFCEHGVVYFRYDIAW